MAVGGGSSSATARVTADEYIAAVRAYADRVHDDVRRLGCDPAEAAEVVETSALDLLEAAKVRPETVSDLVGTWFLAAHRLCDRLLGSDRSAPPPDSPAALLSGTTDDDVARESLANLASRDRRALLLRDAYDLSYTSTAVALDLRDTDEAAAMVARARLRFAAESDGQRVPSSGHEADLARLGRYVDGRVEEERERRIRAHVSRCKTCGPAEPRMRETRRQLAGLALLALPDAERDALLARVSAAARRLLPAARPPVRSRRTPLLRAPVVALSLAVAAILGSAVGAITADDTPNAPAASTGIVTEPTVQPSGATTAPSATTSSRLPTRSSAPRTTSAPPSTAPASTTPPPVRTTTPPPVTTTSPPTPIGPADLTLSPTSGPNSTVITVVGSGWTPGRRVQLTYLDVLGRPTGSGGEASPGPRGTFRTTIAAFDPSNIPGPHTVVATNGVSEVRRTFRAT